ncbi:MAG: putative PurR-regulated permease PerM [Nitriliruptoraceae bacterium]
MRWLQRVWLSIGTAVLLLAVWWVLRDALALAMPPIAIAAVLIYLLNPAVATMHRFGVPRPLGALVSYLAAGVVVWVALAAAGPLLLGQARELFDELPRIGVAIQDSVNTQLVRFGVSESSLLQLDTEALGGTVQDWLTTNRDQVLQLLRGAGSVVTWVVHLGLAVTLGPILAFYALSDLPRLAAGVGRMLPPDGREEVVEVGGRISRIVGSYFRGQMLVATFVGTATAIGLAAIGLPFWAVVGIVTGLFNLVPLVGPTAGAVFGVLLALTVGSGIQQAVLTLAVMIAVQQIDNHVFTPLIVSRSVEIHPITVILALVVAGSLGGIPLMFIAIPAVAVIKLMVLYLAVTRLPSMAHLAADLDGGAQAERGTVARLAQELRASMERRLGATEAGSVIRRRHASGGDGDGDRDGGDDVADVSGPPGPVRPS